MNNINKKPRKLDSIDITELIDRVSNKSYEVNFDHSLELFEKIETTIN